MGVVVIGALYWGFDKKFGKFIGLNMLSTMVLNPLIKNLFFRVRPYFANENIKCLKKVDESADLYDVAAQGYSFPSGHAMSSTALFASMSIYLKKKAFTIFSVVIVMLVCFSRFALGVHYPTDVIVGAILSLLVVLLFTKLQNKISQEKIMIVTALLYAIGFVYCKTDDYYQLYGMFVGFVVTCIFEKKYINFKNTNNKLKIIIRTVVGGLLFLAVKSILKLPFDAEFLSSRSFLANLVTWFRYFISVFVAMGIYPTIFKYNLLKLDDKNKDGE